MRTSASLLILVCSLLGCSRRSADQSQKAPEGLAQSYHSHNGLITVHYPSSFAAKTVGPVRQVSLLRWSATLGGIMFPVLAWCATRATGHTRCTKEDRARAIKAASATLILAETCAAQPASPRPRAR
jgi:hypothetical protein